MGYYRYQPDANHFNGIGLSNEDRESVIAMHSKSIVRTPAWQPPVVHGFDDNPGVEADFPSLSDYNEIPIFSQRGWDVLRPLIGNVCEALPIRHPTGQPFYIINVLDIVDCIDEENSVVDRYSDGRVRRVIRFCFKLNMLVGKHIFKTPRMSGSDLILSEAFRHTVENNGLKGLIFRELPMVEGGSPTRSIE
jgi:hypothetical protein